MGLHIGYKCKCQQNLEKIARVQVDKDTITHLKNLRKFRNKLTHFTAGLDPTQTKSLVAKSMAICIKFCEEQGMITQEAENKLGEIHQNLTELQEFVDERMKTISEEWEGALVVECPECWREALEVWPESHWPGFALREADVFKTYMAWWCM